MHIQFVQADPHNITWSAHIHESEDHNHFETQAKLVCRIKIDQSLAVKPRRITLVAVVLVSLSIKWHYHLLVKG